MLWGGYEGGAGVGKGVGGGRVREGGGGGCHALGGGVGVYEGSNGSVEHTLAALRADLLVVKRSKAVVKQ